MYKKKKETVFEPFECVLYWTIYIILYIFVWLFIFFHLPDTWFIWINLTIMYYWMIFLHDLEERFEDGGKSIYWLVWAYFSWLIRITLDSFSLVETFIITIIFLYVADQNKLRDYYISRYVFKLIKFIKFYF
jgi:hypothetical protein